MKSNAYCWYAKVKDEKLASLAKEIAKRREDQQKQRKNRLQMWSLIDAYFALMFIKSDTEIYT